MELAHAHIGHPFPGDLGVDMDWLIYERPAEQFKYPYAFDVPLNSWVELVCAIATYDQAGFVLLSDVFQSSFFSQVRPWRRWNVSSLSTLAKARFQGPNVLDWKRRRAARTRPGHTWRWRRPARPRS